MALFEELNRDDDLTLIMVTHEEHIARQARRILRVEDGVLVADERVEDGDADAISSIAHPAEAP